MRWLTGMLTTLVSVVSILGAVGATIAKAQNAVIPLEDAPTLEIADSASATDLTGLQNRQTQLDYGFLFLPDGAGGERPAASVQENARIVSLNSDAATSLSPIAAPLPSFSQGLPPYAVVKPNRAIETQTDPQRLTVVAPASQQQ